MRVKLSKLTRETIQSAIMNFISTLTDNDELDIEFCNIDDGNTNTISLIATKNSNNPNICKTIVLKDNVLNVDCSPIANDVNKNATQGTT